MKPQRALRPPLPLTACLAGALFLLCLAGQGAAQRPSPSPVPSPAPFSPDETRHGFSQFDTIPPAPEDAAPAPLDYYGNEAPDARRSRERRHDGPPGGLFRHVTLAHDVEEELDVRRGHLYVPVRPAGTFAPDTTAVYAVFRVFEHYTPYHVIGRLIPERAPGVSVDTVADEDTAALAVEDDSGYLKFFPPTPAGWKPGLYRIDIFVGYEATDRTRMGAVRFTIAPGEAAAPAGTPFDPP